jgi:hypothetical protein
MQIVNGAWNEQHAYSVASDFAQIPGSWWYMGDIPHGWAAAEFQLLMRDICFFESGEDDGPHECFPEGLRTPQYQRARRWPPRRTSDERGGDDDVCVVRS